MCLGVCVVPIRLNHTDTEAQKRQRNDDYAEEEPTFRPRNIMPKVMLRKGNTGKLVFYIAKKDLEDEVVSLQFDQPDKWGGELS